MLHHVGKFLHLAIALHPGKGIRSPAPGKCRSVGAACPSALVAWALERGKSQRKIVVPRGPKLKVSSLNERSPLSPPHRLHRRHAAHAFLYGGDSRLPPPAQLRTRFLLPLPVP